MGLTEKKMTRNSLLGLAFPPTQKIVHIKRKTGASLKDATFCCKPNVKTPGISYQSVPSLYVGWNYLENIPDNLFFSKDANIK